MKPLTEELLDTAAKWKVDAVNVIERSPAASPATVANQMLSACADMLIEKVRSRVESADGNLGRHIGVHG